MNKEEINSTYTSSGFLVIFVNEKASESAKLGASIDEFKAGIMSADNEQKGALYPLRANSSDQMEINNGLQGNEADMI